MVVLAATVTTKSGKVLLSRQYIDTSRIRIEGLLSAFPKLIGSDSQHTYVETDSVRYVYQPVESLYVLLVTTKTSNIVEDLDTLRLLSKIIPEYAPRFGAVDEDAVQTAAFDIIHSFDEVLDWGGYRENVTLPQIATFVEMYSHEDRLAKMIKESKELEAKEEMKRRAKAISKQKGGADGMAFGKEIGTIMESAGLGGLAKDLGFANNPMMAAAAMKGDLSSQSGFSSAQYSQQNPSMSDLERNLGGMKGLGGPGGMSSGYGGGGQQAPIKSQPMSFDRPSNAPTAKASMASKGMALGGKSKKQDNLLDAMRAEGEFVDAAPVRSGKKAAAAAAAAAAAPAQAYTAPTEAVHLACLEKISVSLDKDGGVQKMELKGDLMLRVTDASKGAIRIAVNMGENPGFQIRTHPKIDKNLFSSSSTLGLKDATTPFPSGNPLGVLRWRLETKDEDLIPLSINCWPSEAGNGSQVNIEYELLGKSPDLYNVVIAIPCPSGQQAPQPTQCDGDFAYNSRKQLVEWRNPVVDKSNSQGSLEFTTQAPIDPSAFFPIEVTFTGKTPYAQIAIGGVTDAQSGQPVKFSQEVSFSSEDYTVV